MIFYGQSANASSINKLNIRFALDFTYFLDQRYVLVRVFVPAHLSSQVKFSELLENLKKTGKVQDHSWSKESEGTDENWINLSIENSFLESDIRQLQTILS